MKNRIKKIGVYGPTYVDKTIYLEDPISLDGSSSIERESEEPGGTGLCYSVALARLGCGVNLFSRIGNDDNGVRVQRFVDEEKNLNANWQFDSVTDHAYILIDNGNHKTVASRKEASHRWDTEKLSPQQMEHSSAIVITSFSNDIVRRILEKVSQLEEKPFVMWAPHLPNARDAESLTDLLHLVDHISLSKEEYNELTRSVGSAINHGVTSLTVTNGKNGCDLITVDGSKHLDPIQVVENPLDTNGAGEAFGAAYLATYLLTGNREQAVRAGSHNGYLHVHNIGINFPRYNITDRIKSNKVSEVEHIQTIL